MDLEGSVVEGGGSVFVSVCGRVERVDVPQVTLDDLCAAVSTRFDLGGRLRFVAEEEGEPEVQTDEQLERHVLERRTLRVIIGDSALAELEQRMWQLRQLQWGFFQDELARMKNSQLTIRSETRQLRQALEQSARREVELTGELMGERRAREKAEQVSVERHEAVTADMRRETRAREAVEAAMRKEIEEARQASLKYAAASERQVAELKNALVEESRARGKNIEALLSEWAGSQAEIRKALDALRADVEKVAQDSERQSMGLLREGSAREAFEQFFGEKIRSIELTVGKVETNTDELADRLEAAKGEAVEATRAEAAERVAGEQELQWVVCELRDEARRVAAENVALSTDASCAGAERPAMVARPGGAPARAPMPGTFAAHQAEKPMQLSAVSLSSTLRRGPSQGHMLSGSQSTVSGSQPRTPSQTPIVRPTTPPPFAPQGALPAPGQPVRRGFSPAGHATLQARMVP